MERVGFAARETERVCCELSIKPEVTKTLYKPAHNHSFFTQTTRASFSGQIFSLNFTCTFYNGRLLLQPFLASLREKRDEVAYGWVHILLHCYYLIIIQFLRKYRSILGPSKYKIAFYHYVSCIRCGINVIISSSVGLDAAGKTTVLYKLKLGEVVTTIPTLGNKLQIINVMD